MTDEFDQFDEPGSLESIKWPDYEGRLLLITPRETKVMPTYDRTGEREVIVGDVAILDGPGAPEVIMATPIYPGYLQGQVRRNTGTGRSNLGRLGKDTTRQQRNQDPPWVLGVPTEADKQIARDYLRAKASRPVTGTGTGDTSHLTGGEPPF